MGMFSRNNFGTNVTHFCPELFASKRQCRKKLRKICGRGYPISPDDLLSSLGTSRYSNCVLLLNQRGVEKFSAIADGRIDIESLKTDPYQIARRDQDEISIETQAWRIMSRTYNFEWTMKEPVQ